MDRQTQIQTDMKTDMSTHIYTGKGMFRPVDTRAVGKIERKTAAYHQII